jgi:DivIVA domain-containing protein
LVNIVSDVVFVVLAGVLVVAAGFAAAGRFGALPHAEPDGAPLELPSASELTTDDLEAVRLGVAFRGYRMDEVDELLHRLQAAMSARDERIASLQAVLSTSTTAESASADGVNADGVNADVTDVMTTDHVPSESRDRTTSESTI